MQPVSIEVTTGRPLWNSAAPWPVRRAKLLVAELIIALIGGCTTTLDSLVPGHEGPPTGTPACQLVATWSNQVVLTPDPAHNGEPVPGLAGRVYLFGQTIDYPVGGDGAITVDLFDDSHPNVGKPSQPLEEWRIGRATLERLVRRDPIGWGYTIFLPWGTYRPDITRVHLKLRYDPTKGTPLFSSSALTLNKDGGNEPGIVSQLGGTSMPKAANAQTAHSINPQIAPKTRS